MSVGLQLCQDNLRAKAEIPIEQRGDDEVKYAEVRFSACAFRFFRQTSEDFSVDSCRQSRAVPPQSQSPSARASVRMASVVGPGPCQRVVL